MVAAIRATFAMVFVTLDDVLVDLARVLMDLAVGHLDQATQELALLSVLGGRRPASVEGRLQPGERVSDVAHLGSGGGDGGGVPTVVSAIFVQVMAVVGGAAAVGRAA